MSGVASQRARVQRVPARRPRFGVHRHRVWVLWFAGAVLLAACTSAVSDSSTKTTTTVHQETPSTDSGLEEEPGDPVGTDTATPSVTPSEPRTASTGDRPAAGVWKVTELTGSISATETGPAPPEGLCAPFSETYEPVISSPDTWIELIPLASERMWESDIEAMLFQDALDALRAEGLDITPYGNDEVASLPGAADDLFVFSFAFDNGFQTNDSVIGTGTSYLTIELGSTSTEYWGVFDGTYDVVLGGVTSMISGVLSGKSAFKVQGSWQAPDRLTGSWLWSEFSEGTGCKLVGTGQGTWTAVAP